MQYGDDRMCFSLMRENQKNGLFFNFLNLELFSSIVICLYVGSMRCPSDAHCTSWNALRPLGGARDAVVKTMLRWGIVKNPRKRGRARGIGGVRSSPQDGTPAKPGFLQALPAKNAPNTIRR
jgi:hypothetical protein